MDFNGHQTVQGPNETLSGDIRNSSDPITLNTHHKTGKSEKIICRTIKIIWTLPKIVGMGESKIILTILLCVAVLTLVRLICCLDLFIIYPLKMKIM